MSKYKVALGILTGVLACVGSPRVASAVELELVTEWFGTDTTAPEFANGQNSYSMGGFANGDYYSFYVDFFLNTTSITDSTLYVYYYDENGHIYDYDYSGEVEGDMDVTMLGAGITLPPGATGVVGIEFTISFADGSQLNDFRYVELD
jgi:hypothetical protein